MLTNMNPLFDNIEYREEISNTEDLFLQDYERQSCLHALDHFYDEEHMSATYGNRNYLMLISQYYEDLKSGNKGPESRNSKEFEALRQSLLALHTGDSKNLDFFVQQLGLIDKSFGEGNRSLKDNLWARFRASSQRIFIHEALKTRSQGDLDDFDTYYSDFLDEESIKQLESLYKNGIDFTDIDSVFKEAISKSRVQSITDLETIQWEILKAAFVSSSP